MGRSFLTLMEALHGISVHRICGFHRLILDQRRRRSGDTKGAGKMVRVKAMA